MNNQVLLWMNPEKHGVLKKRGGRRKNWKIRQFLVKDTFLFYFKLARGGEQVMPSGVVPLQGSKVDLSPQEEHETEGDEPAPTYVFVIFLPDKLLKEGVVKRNTYFLGGENLTDCYLWMKAIRHASTSRRIVKGQLSHARLELMELEGRWNAFKAVDADELPPMKANFDPQEEDPLILQALSDDLMILYRLVEIAAKGLNEERARKANAQSQFEMIQHRIDLQLLELMEQGKRVKAEAGSNALLKLTQGDTHVAELHEGPVVFSILVAYYRPKRWCGNACDSRMPSDVSLERSGLLPAVQFLPSEYLCNADYKEYHARLGDLIKKRFKLRKVSDQLEMFEGKIVGGPGLPSMSAVECMLLTTIEELNKLEDVRAGTEQMPPEDRLVELELAIVPVQEEYMELLNLATYGERKHEATMVAVAPEAAADAVTAEESQDEISAEEASFRSSILTGGFSK